MTGFDSNWLLSRMAREKAKAYPAEPVIAGDAVEYESDLHDDIIEACRARGWIAIHSRMDMPTTTAKGVPDFIILADRGRLFLFECKNRTEKLKPEQIGFAMMADQLGFTVHLIRSMSEFLTIINNQHPTKTL